MKNYDLSKIKMIATDLDGVLTDGHFVIDQNANEQKKICFRDLDAVGIGRKLGLDFIIVTGENNALVNVIAGRFSILKVLSGVKDKLVALKSICENEKLSMHQICYIGDSFRDKEAILQSGFGVAPNNASKIVKESADYITESWGGDGVLAEVVELFIDLHK